MTGGVIKDNNNSLTEEARRSTRGDGVYVGTAFNLGGAAEISTNNDVYLEKGAREAKRRALYQCDFFLYRCKHCETNSNPQ